MTNLTDREVEFLRQLCAYYWEGRILGESIAERGRNQALARDLYFKLAEVPVR